MDIKVGMRIKGIVTGIATYGVFVDLGDNKRGFIHISEVRSGFVSNLKDIFAIGQNVFPMVIDIDEYDQNISLSLRSQKVDFSVLHKNIVLNRRKFYFWTDFRLLKGFTRLADKRPAWINEALKQFQ